ncbi:hypothetical protein EC915_101802 [Pseudomonas sp. LP_7_YM]|nr:hypothetical protein EC915_101802 [Pseudomonas sp. LP_7_YM]
MKHVIALLLPIISFSSSAADPVTLPMAIQIQKLADASLCEAYKGDASPFGKAMSKHCRDRHRAEFEALQDEKPLRACIKPGNVIDDDVRKCMKGI